MLGNFRRARLGVIMAAALMSLGWTGGANAAAIFAPGDFILGGAVNGTDFEVGDAGFDQDANNWPGGESPDRMIDGVGQKYLNFAGDDIPTGALVTPGFGNSIVNSIQLWTANDREPRDPTSYQVYGTKGSILAANPGDTVGLASFSLIAEGPTGLPSSRNAGGDSVLDDANSVTLMFANMDAFTSYLILFPTVKDAADANSMQIAEVQLFGERVAAVPLPAALPLLGFGLAVLGFVGRRRKQTAT